MAQRSQSEWFGTDDPDVLLRIVRPPVVWPAVPEPPPPPVARRLQLLACACARMVWDQLPTDARSAILIRERFAEGRATEADLRASSLRWGSGVSNAHGYALASARGATGYRWTDALEVPTNWDASNAAREAAKSLASRAAGPAPRAGRADAWHDAWNAAFLLARGYQAELVRDVFAPPGYAPALRAEWRTSTVGAVARQMDETGDFSAAPILADALQDAGCDDEVMLGRCRAPSRVHCRGNWVVDLVLDRD